MTVTALEPPRALGPVLDPSVVISLDVLDASSTPASQPEKPAPTIAVPDDALLELRLDEMLGTAVKQPVDQELEAELDADLAEVLAAALPDDEPGDSPTVFTEPMVSTEPSAPSASPEGERRDHAASVEAVAFEATAMTTYVIAEIDSGDHDAAPVLEAARVQSVRRRTPTAMPARHPAATIPKATGSNGQALPRAYFVAKRRTPSAGIATVDGAMREDNRAAQSDVAASLSPAPAELDSRSGDAAATTIIPSPPVSAARVLRPDEPSGAHSMLLRPVVPNNAAPHESPAGPEPTGGGSAIARSSAARGPLTILLVAVLLGFAIIVLFTLRP
jgi:hypothetical protein